MKIDYNWLVEHDACSNSLLEYQRVFGTRKKVNIINLVHECCIRYKYADALWLYVEMLNTHKPSRKYVWLYSRTDLVKVIYWTNRENAWDSVNSKKSDGMFLRDYEKKRVVKETGLSEKDFSKLCKQLT